MRLRRAFVARLVLLSLCVSAHACVYRRENQRPGDCSDEQDNDGDGRTDCADADCSFYTHCREDTFLVQPPPTPQFASIDFSCQDDTEAGWNFWQFRFVADAATRVDLDIVESAAPAETRWVESAHMTDAELLLRLDHVTTPDEVVIAVSGQGTTLHDCSRNDGASLAYRGTLFDLNGMPVDCAIWGFAAQQAFAESGCLCFDVDGDCSN